MNEVSLLSIKLLSIVLLLPPFDPVVYVYRSHWEVCIEEGSSGGGGSTSAAAPSHNPFLELELVNGLQTIIVWYLSTRDREKYLLKKNNSFIQISKLLRSEEEVLRLSSQNHKHKHHHYTIM